MEICKYELGLNVSLPPSKYGFWWVKTVTISDILSKGSWEQSVEKPVLGVLGVNGKAPVGLD